MPSLSPPARLILGSSSVYRKELLSRLGLPFEVMSPDIDETALPGESPAATALRLAQQKAEAIGVVARLAYLLAVERGDLIRADNE